MRVRAALLSTASLPVLASALACGVADTPPAPARANSTPAAAAATAAAPLPAAELTALPGRLLFLAEGDADVEIATTLPSGQDRRTLLRGPRGHEGPTLFPGPAAPGGAHLVVVTVEGEGDAHRERLEIRPLTDAGLGEPIWRSDAAPQVRNPAWSPDGRALAFEASFDSFRDLYRVDLAPAGEPVLLRLTNHPAGNYEPAFSPDGRELAFTSSRDGNAEVYVMPAAGGPPRRLTDAPLDDWGPVWAPDGRTLAFLSNRGGVDRIYLCAADGGDLRPVRAGAPQRPPAGAVGPTDDEAEPAFAPEGRALAFSVRSGPGRAALRLADLTSGAVVDLTPGTASDRSPVWSPTGEHLVFTSDRDGDPELYVIRRDGSALARVSERPGADWLVRWPPR